MRWRATRTARATSMVESCGTLPLPSAFGGRAPAGAACRRDCLFSVAGPGPASPCRRVQSLRCGGRPAGAASLSMARRLWRLKSFFQTFPVIWRMKEAQKKERTRGLIIIMPYVPVSQTAPSPRAAAVRSSADGGGPPTPLTRMDDDWDIDDGQLSRTPQPLLPVRSLPRRRPVVLRRRRPPHCRGVLGVAVVGGIRKAHSPACVRLHGAKCRRSSARGVGLRRGVCVCLGN